MKTTGKTEATAGGRGSSSSAYERETRTAGKGRAAYGCARCTWLDVVAVLKD